MCIKAVWVDPSFLRLVPDHFKTRDMCDKAVEEDPELLEYVPDWFVTREWVYMWYDDIEYCDEDNFFKWYHDHQNGKAQKASIKEELLPIV